MKLACNKIRNMDVSSEKTVLVVLMVCGISMVASQSHVTVSSCYVFYNQSRNWNESETYCNNEGGHLVSIETKEEWELINSCIQNRTSSYNEWYIGLSNNTGDWKWMNNRRLNFSKWQLFQPSGDGKCVVMAKHYPNGSHGLWNDLPCSFKKSFICEYDQARDICKKIIRDRENTPTKGIYATEIFNSSNKNGPTKGNIISTPSEAVSHSFPNDLVYVVIGLGLLLACGISFYAYVFCCKNRIAGLSLRRHKYRSCGFQRRTSSRLEEGLAPVHAVPATESRVQEDDSQTYRKDPSESQEPAKLAMEHSAERDYLLPDPSTESTYAALYPIVQVQLKKPEENKDTTAPKMPSPYNKAEAGEPVVYATIDKYKKTKAGSRQVKVVYATITIDKRLEEGLAPVHAVPATESSVQNDDSQTHRKDSSESQEPAKVTMGHSAERDYLLPDPSTDSTYVALHPSVQVEQKKPEENKDTTAPKMPSPYHKAAGKQPVVYATIDKSKKTKAGSCQEEAVYATIDKSRKNHKNNSKESQG